MNKHFTSLATITMGLVTLTAGCMQSQTPAPVQIAPSEMRPVGSISERFQAYNVEMVEVTGGRFWRPYASVASSAPEAPVTSGAAAPAGMDPSLYEYRPPLDLTNPRLRAMAQALAPSYMRVSGTWANTTYFADTGTPPAEPPAGYGAVLTRDQWLEVIDFSQAVDAPIVTSMPIGAGTRGPDQVWQPDQARTWLDFTRANGGTVAAVEFFNEPTLASMGGAPEGYDAADYARDHQVFTAFMRREFAQTQILAPGSVGEAEGDWSVASGGYGRMALLPVADLARSTGDADAFSYHHYGAVSQRCEVMGHQTSAEAALSEDWLGRTDATLAYYRQARDQFMPGKPMWNTETGETACGGNPWAKTYLDTFRYLDQLGRLARQGVQVVIHNTLAASDYSLLDEQTFEPYPSYWGALLWRRLMGTTVLDSGVEIRAGAHVYAHCLRSQPGGVALLVLNTSQTEPLSLEVPAAARRYTLSAQELTAGSVLLNGQTLALGADNQLPAMDGERVNRGRLSFAPTTISFLALPEANNEACR